MIENERGSWCARCQHATIRFDMIEGPGLAKVRRPRPLKRRSLQLVALLDGSIAARLTSADLVFEGSIREEAGAPRFYGSADLLVKVDDGQRDDLAAVFALDPHVRLRALRIAHREASVRVDAPLGTMRAELTVEKRASAICIHVELEAEVLRLPRTSALVP